MSFPYSPSPVALGSVTLTLPNDGDPRIAASVNDPFQKLADAIAYLTAHATILAPTTIVGGGPGSGNVTGSVVAPTGCVAAIVSGWGAGAGGGAGGNDIWNDRASTGGGGGGGARRVIDVVPIVGGESYSWIIAGAAAAGANGNDTILTRVSTSAQIFKARGAGRGINGAPFDRTNWTPTSSSVNTNFDVYGATKGGRSVATTSLPSNFVNAVRTSVSPGAFEAPQPQDGGNGLSQLLTLVGMTLYLGVGGNSPEGYSGGAPGAAGLDYGGIYKGGGGGGGGGAGPGGAGGQGGAGSGAADVVSSLSPGSNGSDATAGSGAGGGGGGGTGETNATSAGVPGGTGGRGGSGAMSIWFLTKA